MTGVPTKRVFIIHGWGCTPDANWYGWLKSELEKKGFYASVPAMPDTNFPVIERWVAHLKELVGTPDQDTYLVGHSMGCQTILRYLESLDGSKRVGGALFVAGFLTLKEGWMNADEQRIARPWIENRIDLEKARKHSAGFVSIFSGNDQYVSLGDSAVFEAGLGSKIIVIPNGGHFTLASGYKELHVALNELLKMAH